MWCICRDHIASCSRERGYLPQALSPNPKSQAPNPKPEPWAFVNVALPGRRCDPQSVARRSRRWRGSRSKTISKGAGHISLLRFASTSTCRMAWCANLTRDRSLTVTHIYKRIQDLPLFVGGAVLGGRGGGFGLRFGCYGLGFRDLGFRILGLTGLGL